MRDKSLLVAASSFELATGIVAVAVPSFVAKLLFSVGLTPGEKATSRLWGFGLVSLAVACWPRDEGDHTQAIRALFLYNLLAACYLGYLRIVGEFSGLFLLPGCFVHGLLSLLFVRPVYEGVIGKGPKI